MNEILDITLDDRDAILEALIFVSEEPLTLQKLQTLWPEITEEELEESVERLNEAYQKNRGTFVIRRRGIGYVLMTEDKFAPIIERVWQQKKRKRISGNLLEVLAVVAYRQPITKAEVDALRSKDSGYYLKKLLEMDFVTITGRKEVPGRPLLYGTTDEFLEAVGLSSLEGLVKIEEFDRA